MVKAGDLRSSGQCPRGFEPHSYHVLSLYKIYIKINKNNNNNIIKNIIIIL